jgi:CrcB protein
VTVLAIAIGGALGSVSRYLIAVRLADILGVNVPYGTLTVNVLGCLILGVVIALIQERGAFGPEARSFITIGFLGGMTTFSTFIYEDWQFVREDDLMRAGVYALGSLALGFLAFVLGHAAGRAVEG